MSRSNHRVAVLGVLFAFVLPRIAFAVSITSTAPPGNEKSASRATNIAATADATIQSSTVTQSTFRVQGDQTGRIAGAYSATGSTFTLDPSNDLKPGETIRATATSGIEDISASALTPRVWQFTAAAGAGTGVMVAHPTALTSATSDDVALADLDGDGDLDAVIANADNNAESVWLNDGTGTFAPHPSIPAFGAENTFSIALGDLDGDGDLDLVAGNWQPPWYETVWLNDGTGGFTAHPVTPLFGSGDTWDLALGDLDGDGDLDCLVSNHSFETNTVWLNDGNGSFTAHPTAPGFGGVDSLGLALGDLDGDGDLDTVIARDGAESVWLNDGSGAFTAHPTTPDFGGDETNEVALGDLDGDGDLDAVLANGFGDTVWLNDGAGNFTAHPTTPSVAGGTNTKSVVLGDIDGDGDLDGILANFVFPHTVWLNDGAGNLTAHPIGSSFSGNSFVRGMALGDLDGDDDLDGVTVNSSGSNPNVWFNAEVNVYPNGVTTTEAGGTATFSVVLNRQPTANVVIQLDTSDATEGRLSTDGVTQQNSVTLTFTDGDWSTPQVVTVHGQNDGVNDGNIAYTITTTAAVSSDPFFSGSNAEDVFASNTDDDTAGITVTPTTLANTTENGFLRQFTVVLTSQPVADVSIQLDTSDPTEAKVSTDNATYLNSVTITFTTANWNTSRTIFVRGQQDFIDDGHVAFTIITQPATSIDPLYSGFDAANVSGICTDDDFAGVTVSRLGVTVHESGTTATFTVVLKTEPTGDVVIDAVPDDATEASASPSPLTFTSADWSTPQQVTVTGVDDAGDDGNQTTSISISMNVAATADAVYDAIDPADVLVLTVDDEEVLIIDTDPESNATSVSRTSNVQATADESINAATATASTFRVHGGFTGRIDGTYGGSGASFHLDPATGFKAGEKIDATVTGGVQSATASPVTPFVWQFTAATSKSSGKLFPHPVTPSFGGLDSEGAALGDIDGDGDLDAVIANYYDPETVWLNDGSGNFQAHSTPSFATTDSTLTVVLGDVDNDGDLDAITGDTLIGGIVWHNDGTGVFTAGDEFNSGLGSMTSIALGDVDGDGDLDAVAANLQAPAGVHLNDGTGVFTNHPFTPGFATNAVYGSDIALGDLDDDGDLDAVLTDSGAEASNSVWLNDGFGNFSAHPITPLIPGDFEVTLSVALGDLDGDGDLDAVLIGADGTTVWVNDGSGSFSAHGTPAVGDFSGNAVALGDLDGDGDLDAVIADSGGGAQETLWLNNGAGVFTAHPETPEFGGNGTFEVVLGDLDGDNDLDVLLAGNDQELVWLNAGIGISPVQGLVTTEDGLTDTFEVTLEAVPSANVSIQLDSADTSEAMLSTGGPQQSSVTLVFTPLDWSTPRTVTVHGVNDGVADGNVAYTIVTNAAVSSDPVYSGADPADISGTNLDDDATGVIVSPRAVTVSESATTATFDISLDNVPAGDVVIDVASTDTGEATVSPSQLTFTTANFSTPQPVTVTGVNDAMDDGSQLTRIGVTVNAALTVDPAYHTIDPPDVLATTTDDDFGIVSTNPIANAHDAPRTTNIAATAEGPVNPSTITQANFRARGSFTAQIPGTYSASGATFTFNPANDLKPGETIALTATSGIQSSTAVPLVPHVWQFTAAAGIATGSMIQHGSFGGQPTLAVALGDLDGDGDLDVMVANYKDSPAADDSETVWLNDGSGNFTQHPTSFGAGDSWDIALGDIDGDGDLDAIIANSNAAATVWVNDGGGGFSAHSTATLAGSVSHNSASLGDLDGDGDLDAFLAGGGAERVWLNDGTGTFFPHPTTPSFGDGQHHGSALGDLDGDGDLDAVVAGSGGAVPERVWLNDGAGNFSAPATFPTFDAGVAYGITLGDLDSDGDLDAVAVSIDLDEGTTIWLNNGFGRFERHPAIPSIGTGLTGITPALGDLDGDGDLDLIVTRREGEPESVWVNDGSGGFTPHPISPEINGATTFGVALGDIDGDGDLDAVFGNYSSYPETVWINRSAAGVTVTPETGLVTTEAGGTATFTVVLTSAPIADVSIVVASSDTTEGRVSTDGVTQQNSVTLTFTTSNWDDAQTVTVHGQNDAVDDGNISYTIETQAATSTDPLYSGFDAGNVSASNTDNDTAGVTVTPAAVTVSETGTTANFTVVLHTEPTGNVVIDVASADTGEATVSPAQLTFTTSDWATPKNVTVTGVDDAIDDGDQNTNIAVTMNAGLTADPLYDPINPADVTATTTDNDDPPFGPPPNVAATPTGTTIVNVTWGAVTGATSYEVWRTTSIAVPYTLATTTANTFFTDGGRSANTTYLYQVRTNGSGGPSAFSPVDAATTVVFTDPALSSAIRIKAIHLTQLRTAVNAMRAAANVSAATFTDTPPIVIRRIHIVELRTALNQARAAIGLSALSYTDPTITSGVTKARKEHVSELREGTR